MNDELKELMDYCKCGLYIEINPQKDTYDTAEQWFKDRARGDEEFEKEIKEDPEIQKCIKENIIIEITAYPRTPIGNVIGYYTDIDEAIKNMIRVCKEY